MQVNTLLAATLTVLACRPTHEAAKFLSTLAAKEASLPEIRQRRDMDDDHRELVRRLFAAATALIETAHDAAIAGQSGAIAAGEGPRDAMIVFGYAGWAPGQLEGEIETGGWVIVPSSDELVFGADNETKWSRALASHAVDL